MSETNVQEDLGYVLDELTPKERAKEYLEGMRERLNIEEPYE